MGGAVAAAAFGALLAAAAVGFDSPSLAPAGAGLIVAAVAAATWVLLAVRGAKVERRLARHQIEEGQALAIEMTVTPGSLPFPGGEIHDGAGAVLALRRRGHSRIRTEMRFERRGRHRLAPVRAEVRDPLSIAVRALGTDPDGAEVLVLPRIHPIVAVPGGGARGSGDGARGGDRMLAAAAGRLGAELEFAGLGPYTPGASAGRIFWPSLARGGDLLERRLAADADDAPLVVLDMSGGAAEQELDALVRAVASITHSLAASRGCALLLAGERRPRSLEPGLGGWPEAHARLALAEAGGPRPPLSRATRAGAVVWASTGPPPRELTRLAGGGAWHVTPSAPGAPGARYTVAGCSVVALGRAGREAA